MTPAAPPSPRVLVVDDDRAVRESLRRSLEFNGYAVSLARDGAEALAAIAGSAPDALVIDVMMPRLDGIETTRALRSAGNDLPILVLTARDSVGDRVEGLDAGADDYLTKPFALEELLARLRALLRRAHAPVDGDDLDEDVLTFADLSLNPATREVRRGDRGIELTRTEFTLLGDVPAPTPTGAGPLVHPRGGLGLRLPDHREQPRGLRRLPAPQDRGGGRAAAAPHRARRRLRPEVVIRVPHGRRGWLRRRSPGEPGRLSRRLQYRGSLARRLILLTTFAVAMSVALVALAAYVTVRHQLQSSIDDSLHRRAYLRRATSPASTPCPACPPG